MQAFSVPPVSRLAPTPSGFLHLGNALNFILTWLVVRQGGGRLHLRIDDMDGIRCRPEVVEDIFFSLDWLGLDWDAGPSGPEDFYARFSLMQRMELYSQALFPLMEKKRVYACTCSRKSIARAVGDGVYPGFCRTAGHRLEPGKTALRLRVPANTEICVGNRTFRLDEAFGDFVLWRKENLAAYHLASVLEDVSMGVTLVIRGEDLFPSTAAQIFLARMLDLNAFGAIAFRHHGLVLGKGGEKLSKSRGAYALSDMREAGQSPLGVWRFVADFLGLPSSLSMGSLKDLQEAFGEASEKKGTLYSF